MLEELERRNYSAETTRRYLRFVERFAQHFGKSPDKLGPDHLRTYQAYLLKVRKLDPGSVENHVAALRFLYVRTLGRHEFRQFLPVPALSQGSPEAAQDPEPGRSGTSDRCQQRPVRAHVADGSVRHGHASCRGSAAEDRRHRKPAHGPSRRERQGRQGSRSAAEPEAAGDAAGLLAVAQATDLSVSLTHAPRLRAADYRQDCVAYLHRSCPEGRH